MGRLGPLTSMALGRSPYDDVVMGEGEGDPRAPLQMYDERGRPVNPETKRINRDVIRSHNEVMLVIGVVESENSIDELRAEQLRRYDHEQHDVRVGRRLEDAARVCELAGVWGISGLRQRILLYREYSQVPFSQLFQHERERRSVPGLLLHGLPAYVAANAMELPWFAERIMSSALLKVAFSYIQTSLKIWILLQRTGLLPASASPWFPSWKYLIPFSSSSAIPSCPLPTSLTPRSIVAWLGGIAWSITPFVAFWAIEGLWLSVREVLYEEIYDLLPNPSNPEQTRTPRDGFVLQRVPTFAEGEAAQSSTPSGPAPLRLQPGAQQEPGPSVGDVWEVPQSGEPSGPSGAEAAPDARARNTSPPNHDNDAPAGGSGPHSRSRRPQGPDPDDFSSDDEDTAEVVSATLISFDVENNPDIPDLNDSNGPPGVWSAELRPNQGNDSQSGGDGPGRDGEETRRPRRLYRDNALTRLPANIAADLFARRASSILLAPLEASAMREVARLWCWARGWSTEAIWEPVWLWPLAFGGGGLGGFRLSFGAGLSFGSLTNFLGLEMLHLLLDAGIWVQIPWIVSRFLVSDEEWEKKQKEKQRRKRSSQINSSVEVVDSNLPRNEPSG